MRSTPPRSRNEARKEPTSLGPTRGTQTRITGSGEGDRGLTGRDAMTSYSLPVADGGNPNPRRERGGEAAGEERWGARRQSGKCEAELETEKKNESFPLPPSLSHFILVFPQV